VTQCSRRSRQLLCVCVCVCDCHTHIDVDVCESVAAHCEHYCNDTVGQLTCICSTGYMENPADPTKCIGLNSLYPFMLFTSDKGGKCDCRRLSVSLSVCWQDYWKSRRWICMKCCVSTDVETWRNWLTFEPDPDHSSDAGTGLLSPISYALQRAEFYYVGKIPPTGIEHDHSPPVAAATRGFEASKDHCRR